MGIDQFIIEFDRALRTLVAPARTVRPVPGSDAAEAELDNAQRRHVAGLMRVNHCGEICAQALYQGQSLTSRDPAIRDALRQAAEEETEHLAWTAARIAELGGRTSLLNPLWYAGSLGLGVAAGLLGDKWNLGFLAETERQVEAHLAEHLQTLPEADARSRAILSVMKDDEARHADHALAAGARILPPPIPTLMAAMSTVMKTVAYRL